VGREPSSIAHSGSIADSTPPGIPGPEPTIRSEQVRAGTNLTGYFGTVQQQTVAQHVVGDDPVASTSIANRKQHARWQIQPDFARRPLDEVTRP